MSNASHLVYAVGTVNTIVDCNKSDIAGRKDDFHIPACFKVVSAETGLVFYDYHPNLSTLDVPHHFYMGRSCEVNSAITVIDIELAVAKAVFICVFLKYEFLVGDTVGFSLEHILLKESAVKGCN